MKKHFKQFLFLTILFFAIPTAANGATEFVSVVDTGNGTGTDYTSLSAWETGVQTDLTAATTLVFAGTKTGTMADNASVTGASSLATATIVHVTSTQILLENISGTFQNGEQIRIDVSNYFTTSNVGDNAIAIAKCRASTGVADTTAVVIDGWTTSATNYIKIWTDQTEVYRHEGKWDDGKYRLNVNANYAIDIENNYVKIDGIQATATGDQVVVVFADPGPVYISNSILKGATWVINQSSGTLYLWNSIIYDATSDGILISWSSLYIYNVTLKDNGGYGLNRDAGNYTVKVKNVIFDNNVSGDATGINGSDYTVSNCATNVASGSSGLNVAGAIDNRYSQTVSFTDTANKDFHLSPSDIGAKNAGTNLSADANLAFTNDIDGEIRPEGATWDIGADQYQGTVANSERNLPANLESGLIGYWSFDSPDTTWASDVTGTTDDLSGNNYDGTLTNMLKASSPIGGISGQGFDFRGQDATANNVSVTHSTAFDSVDITYSAWIKPDTISNWDAITEVTPTQDYFGLYNGQYSIWGRCGNIYLGHTIARNQWAFVAYVISGENYYLYEDGELIASGSGCSTSTTGHGLLKIGARSDDSMGFDGVIDEVRVYSRALSIDEVVQLYKLNAGKMQPNSVLSKPAGLASGLVGHWSFDGPDTAWTSSTAGTTNDLSGNSNTGTMTNMSRLLSPSNGILGQSFLFDGSNDYVDAGDINAMDGISQMTISIWFYRDTQNDNIALEKGVSNINRIGINSNNTIYFNVGNGENAAGYTTNNKVGWFHVAMVFDGTQTGNENRLKGYINNVPQTLSWWSSYTIPDTAPSNSASFQIGHSVGNAMYAKGKFDDVRVYDRALSADEVADLYQTGQMKILK